jgi:hypothetical protein
VVAFLLPSLHKKTFKNPPWEIKKSIQNVWTLYN